MSGYPEVRLDEICEVISGQSPPGSTYNTSGEGLPFYQGKSEFGELFPTPVKWCSEPTKIAQENDVLISVRAPVGPTNLCRETSCIGRGLGALRPKEGVPTRYVLYAMRATVDELAKLATGTTFAAVSGTQLRSHRVRLAPRERRQGIVDHIDEQFSRLDAGIAALRRAQANLKRYRASVLKAACEGRLVPTEAELAQKENRTYETGEQLLRRIQALGAGALGRKKALEPSQAATPQSQYLPVGWATANLGSVTHLDIGFAFKSAEFATSGVRLLRGDNIEPGRLRWADTRYWPIAKLREFESLLIREGEIILAMDRPLISSGLKIARARASDLPCLLVQRMARLRPTITEMTPYLYSIFGTDEFVKHLLGGQTGTQLPHVSGSGILSFVVRIPPLAEQARIVAEVERRLSVADALETTLTANLRRATRLRQSILREVFNGPNADNQKKFSTTAI